MTRTKILRKHWDRIYKSIPIVSNGESRRFNVITLDGFEFIITVINRRKNDD